uniref:Uncharacterized protein n=1 Tax=Cucumis sativus TaxID=3659 RepID=A0A0A0M3I8_CUCSA
MFALSSHFPSLSSSLINLLHLFAFLPQSSSLSDHYNLAPFSYPAIKSKIIFVLSEFKFIMEVLHLVQLSSSTYSKPGFSRNPFEVLMEKEVCRELASSHVCRKSHPQVSKFPEKHKTAISDDEEIERSNLMKTEKVSVKPKLLPNKKSKEVEKVFKEDRERSRQYN